MDNHSQQHNHAQNQKSHIKHMLNIFYPSQTSQPNTNTNSNIQFNTFAQSPAYKLIPPTNYNPNNNNNNHHTVTITNQNNSLSLHTYCTYLLVISITILFIFFLTDLTAQFQTQKQNIQINRRSCVRKYMQNDCDGEIVPAIQQLCRQWKKCQMNQEQVSKTTMFIKVCAKMVNLVISQLGYWVGGAVLIGIAWFVCLYKGSHNREVKNYQYLGKNEGISVNKNNMIQNNAKKQ